MAGTLYSLALSQRFDGKGRPLLNAPLYIYQANTSTPADTFEDFGLEIVNPWPIRTDGVGQIPPFWVEDGAYRARLTDEAGAVVYFDIPFVQALGPSSGEEGGGGGSVDADAIFQTGDPLWIPRSGTRAGWVRHNARTIGSAASGATERANADTQPLFEYLWNNFSNTLCPVTGGRGVSASADFAANKPIATLDMRGRGPMGLDDMGNSAAGVLTGGTPTTPGTSGGAEKLTVPRSALPNETLSFSGTTGAAGAHSVSFNFLDSGGSGLASPGSGNTIGQETKSASVGNHSHPFSGNTSSLNGGVAQTQVNTMDPYRLGTWYVRL